MSQLVKDRARELFLAARALEPDERTAFLQRVTEGEPELQREVRELLEADEQGPDFLESPVLGAGFREHAVDSFITSHEEQQLERIGPYRIERLVGEGGFARVYAARQESPVQRRVAIKLLKPGVATRQVIRRFEAERQHLANMDHPAIAHIFDAGTTDDGRPYFVMEYIDGRPIAKFCRERELDHAARIDLVRRVCEAVQHAHSKGVIHRDLKPSNILVGNGTSEAHIRIIDFGIAKAVRESAPDETLSTRTGQLLGTLPYSSPEQFTPRGRQRVDTRSDVYALGVILYELLTGNLPHDVSRDTVPEAALRITRETPARLSSFDTALRGDLETIVAKALHHDPEQRYQSASELAADLRRFLRGEPILARAPSLSYQLRKLAQRNKGFAVGVVAVCVVFVAAFVWVVWAERRAQREYETARDTAHFLLARVIDDLGQTPGTLELRGELLDKVLPFVAQHQDDAEIARDYARALWVASDLALDQGQVEQAMRDRRAARDILARLVAANPDELDLQAALSIATVKVGDAHKAVGEFERAEALYLEALAIDQALYARVPDEHHYASNLAWSHHRLGARAAKRRDRAAAAAHFDRYDALADELLVMRPDDHPTVYGFFESHSILAGLLRGAGLTEQANEHTQRAWEALGRALEMAPENRRYRRAIPLALRHLSFISRESGDMAEATRMLDDGVARLERLLQIEPQSDELQYLTAGMHTSRASLALTAGDLERGARHLDAAEEILAHALARPSEQLHWGNVEIGLRSAQRRLARLRGDDELAAEYADQVCECYRAAAERVDAELSFLRGHASCLLQDGRDDPEALEAARTYAQRANAYAEGRDAPTLQLLARIELARGDKPEALAAARAAQALVAADSPIARELEQLAARARE
jgi:tRNA A-37 threonylcarbamoyl transferase component Bud32/tetratricopeptide (TPR) repeat protein